MRTGCVHSESTCLYQTFEIQVTKRFCLKNHSKCKMVRAVQLCSIAMMALLLLNNCQFSEQVATFLQPSLRLPRSADPEQEEKCTDNTACGWAIYKPFTRSIENYMRNTCSCPEGFKCLRADDDLSISAFVYRCRKPSTDAN